MACETCSWTVGVTLLTTIQFLPEVAAVLDDVGVDQPLLEQQLTDEVSGERQSDDPLRIELTVTGETATIVVDEEFSVRSVETETE
jgi:hypothetical protein